jgi:short-subunit dehydrogenase
VFARRLAAEKQNLVLVARRASRLERLAQELRDQHGIETRIVAADLATPDGINDVFEQTRDLEIGTLVSNAGRIVTGVFLNRSVEEWIAETRLNVEAHVRLAHHFGGAMARRGRGGVLFVGSMGGFIATPYMANYAGTKSYLSTFAMALSEELQPHGVDVSIVTPGDTDTEMTRDHLGMEPGSMMAPEQVVDEGLAGLVRGRPLTVPGHKNRIALFVLTRLLPKRLMVKTTRGAAEKIIGREATTLRLEG